MELNSDGKLMLNGFYEFWHNRTHRIVICGNAGLGKTTFCKTFIELWRIFSVYFYYEYMKDENNENVLVKYDTTIITEIKAVELIKQYVASETEKDRNMIANRPYIIDEVGDEAIEVKYYGNNSSPIVELLKDRWDRNSRTIILSNKLSGELFNLYGSAVADRFKEYRLIELSGQSMRGGAK